VFKVSFGWIYSKIKHLLFYRCNYPILACLLVLFHDFLDHVDGIVAKVQKRIYGEKIDDPLLGGFMDAFCDKIVNIFCLWTIVQETHFQQTSVFISVGFVALCYTIIALETAIGVVRVQDYFHAALNKNKTSSEGSTSAAMEGKLKEKLESMGLAFLCISTGHLSPFDHWSGVAGLICFSLTIRLAYASLTKKLQARETNKERKKTVTIDLPSEAVSPATSPVQKTIGVVNAFNFPTDKSRHRAMTLDSVTRENEKQKNSNLSSSTTGSNSSLNVRTPPILPKGAINPLINEVKDERSSSTSSSEGQNESSYTYQRSASLPAIWIDGRADKVYTVGCFDLFHEGHRLLLQRMRQFGREVIVGVHDSRSIHKLKNRVPIDGTETRMLNVKRYADQVYCVAGTDPSSFVTCSVYLKENETAIYVRGDDMGDFPSRHVVEELMPVKFLPYTNGVSSTKLRQELFSHIQADDIEHLEKIN
jgi:cytidyltransferase-like protein